MIVILGSDGMLGRAFASLYGSNAICLTRSDCDFTNFTSLERILNSIECSVLINCAAIVDMEFVESFEKEAYDINTLLPFNLARYCNKRGCKFVQISTDHYYIGNLKQHCETSPVTLVNKYAMQKFTAEHLVLNSFRESLVVRTSILGYKNLDGKTFIEWVLKTLKDQKKINGFHDAITSSIDVASLCIYVEKAIYKSLSGIYNIGTLDPYSKYALIRAIIDELELTDIVLSRSSITSLPLNRANSCGLNCNKYFEATETVLPTMHQIVKKLNLKDTFKRI